MHQQVATAVTAIAPNATNTPKLTDAVYTFVHDNCNLGTAAALDSTCANAQHVALVLPFRWAPPTEHARTLATVMPRGAFRAQGVALIMRQLQAYPAAAVMAQRRFPVANRAREVHANLRAQGVYNGSDKEYYLRMACTITVYTTAGDAMVMGDPPAYEVLETEDMDQLIVKLSQFLPRTYTSRAGFRAMRDRVATAVVDPAIAEIEGLLGQPLSDEQKILLTAIAGRSTDVMMAAVDDALEAARTNNVDPARIAAAARLHMAGRAIPTAAAPITAEITALVAEVLSMLTAAEVVISHCPF